MKTLLNRFTSIITTSLLLLVIFDAVADGTNGFSEHTPYTNTLGMKFLPVSIPGRKPVLFCIWKTRVRDFEAFAKTTGYDATKGMFSMSAKLENGQFGDTWKSPGFKQTPDHPVCGVSFNDAAAFCKWLSQTEGRKYRLPTDYEWSYAVGIGEKEKESEMPANKDIMLPGVYTKDGDVKIMGADFPWGKQWPPPKGAGNYAGEECDGESGLGSQVKGWGIKDYNDGFVYTSPVGTFEANRFGLFDLGGNVNELCDCDYDGSGKYKEARGGSFIDNKPNNLQSCSRVRVEPGYSELSGWFPLRVGRRFYALKFIRLF